jgi:hypothetical protein
MRLFIKAAPFLFFMVFSISCTPDKETSSPDYFKRREGMIKTGGI